MKKSFNIQELLHCKSKRHETKLMHPFCLRALQRDQERDPKHPSSVDLIGTKQNKTKQTVPCFMDRLPKPGRKQSRSGEEEGRGLLRSKMKRLLIHINQFEIIIFSWSTRILSHEDVKLFRFFLPSNNYHSFQYLNFFFIYLNCFNILRIISMAKLTLG